MKKTKSIKKNKYTLYNGIFVMPCFCLNSVALVNRFHVLSSLIFMIRINMYFTFNVLRFQLFFVPLFCYLNIRSFFFLSRRFYPLVWSMTEYKSRSLRPIALNLCSFHVFVRKNSLLFFAMWLKIIWSRQKNYGFSPLK